LPTAEELYREFYSQFWRFPAVARLVRKPGERRPGRGVGGYRHWTRIMTHKQTGFFTHLAKRMGYQVSTETVRVDQLWRDSGRRAVVALEHENYYSQIHKELDNLSVVNAPLKVLVTYVRDSEHLWRPLKLADQVKKHLAERGEENDFLLIVGNRPKFNRWIGFRFFPEYTFRADVIPPPTPGLREK
jgi:hypothetical protein